MTHNSLVQTLSARSAAPAVHVCDSPEHAEAVAHAALSAGLGIVPLQVGPRAWEIIVNAEAWK